MNAPARCVARIGALEREAERAPVGLAGGVVEDLLEPESGEPRRGPWREVSLVVVAVDDHRPRAVEARCGRGVQLFKREVDGPGKVLVFELVLRQHLDDLRAFAQGAVHAVPVDRLHGTASVTFRSVLLRLLVFLAVIVGIVVAAFFGLTQRYTVPNDAMEPTMKKGDDMAVLRFEDSFTSPNRKDVGVVEPEPTGACFSKSYVARIIGLPGETVSERDGAVSVDGKPLQEPYVRPADRSSGVTRTLHVPPDSYLCSATTGARSARRPASC